MHWLTICLVSRWYIHLNYIGVILDEYIIGEQI
jgi:hypothetical protein